MKPFLKSVFILGAAYAYGHLLYDGICRLCNIEPAKGTSFITVNKYITTEQKEETNKEKEN